MLSRFIRNILSIAATEDSSNLTNEDIAAYKEEHQRLEKIIGDSENIWEERTFQISAGGLTLTFIVFSFLSSSGVVFDWQIIIIWLVFALCLVLNYVSHRISINNARKMQTFLEKRKKSDKPYDTDILANEFSKHDKYTNWINFAVSTFLIADVIYSLIYTCCYLIKI